MDDIKIPTALGTIRLSVAFDNMGEMIIHHLADASDTTSLAIKKAIDNLDLDKLIDSLVAREIRAVLERKVSNEVNDIISGAIHKQRYNADSKLAQLEKLVKQSVVKWILEMEK